MELTVRFFVQPYRHIFELGITRIAVPTGIATPEDATVRFETMDALATAVSKAGLPRGIAEIGEYAPIITVGTSQLRNLGFRVDDRTGSLQ